MMTKARCLAFAKPYGFAHAATSAGLFAVFFVKKAALKKPSGGILPPRSCPLTYASRKHPRDTHSDYRSVIFLK